MKRKGLFLADWLLSAGAISVVYGVGSVWLPGAFIVGGLFLIIIAIGVNRGLPD